eukprot:scaffold633_cov288-Ochromonas_danica.AAC.89
MDREHARLHLLCHVAMQSEPDVSDRAIQTEFLVPPVKLPALRPSISQTINRSSHCLSLDAMR